MASTTPITDAAGLVGTFSSDTYAKAINATGPIQDMDGNARLLELKFNECKILANQMINACDSADGNKTTIQGILDLLT